MATLDVADPVVGGVQNLVKRVEILDARCPSWPRLLKMRGVAIQNRSQYQGGEEGQVLVQYL